jgi:hypothetical protein
MEEESQQQTILQKDIGPEGRPLKPIIGEQAGTGLDLLKPLLMSGAEFQMNLSKTIGQPSSGETSSPPDQQVPRSVRIRTPGNPF